MNYPMLKRVFALLLSFALCRCLPGCDGPGREAALAYLRAAP